MVYFTYQVSSCHPTRFRNFVDLSAFSWLGDALRTLNMARYLFEAYIQADMNQYNIHHS